MADNVLIPGAGAATAATDEIGGVHYQLVELIDGTAGSTTRILGPAGSLYVDPRPNIIRIQVTPTISTSAYALIDCIGAGMTFTSAARASGGSCVIEEVVVTDLDQERALMDIVFFDRAITATTDNASFDPTDTEVKQVVAVAQIVSATQYSNFTDNCVAVVKMGDVVTLSGSADLFAQIVARSTPTYTGTGDITVTVSVTRL